jgi:hypothetical protein
MKITKSQLKQIIKEELGKLNEGDIADIKYAENEAATGRVRWPGSVSGEVLWQDLNYLLQNWKDKEHQYYKDLRAAMAAHVPESPRQRTAGDAWRERSQGLAGWMPKKD